MLLDELMPTFDVEERHAIGVDASPTAVYAAIREADLAGSLLVRLLLGLRSAPAALFAFARAPSTAIADRRRRRAGRAQVTLATFERAGFRVIAERAPDELVIGLLGKFWTPSGGLCAEVSAEHFAAPPPAGYALAAWNFAVLPRADGSSELRTETRVWCAPDARARFRVYWFFIRPGSGLIRRAMLRAIRRRAEAAHRHKPGWKGATDTRLAVYGTLAPGRANHGQLAALRGRWYRGTVRGRLDSEGWAASMGYPGLVLDAAGPNVEVQVFESAELPGHWARLDEFEGRDYRRVPVRVRTAGGTEVDAWIYVLARDSEPRRA